MPAVQDRGTGCSRVLGFAICFCSLKALVPTSDACRLDFDQYDLSILWALNREIIKNFKRNNEPIVVVTLQGCKQGGPCSNTRGLPAACSRVGDPMIVRSVLQVANLRLLRRSCRIEEKILGASKRIIQLVFDIPPVPADRGRSLGRGEARLQPKRAYRRRLFKRITTGDILEVLYGYPRSALGSPHRVPMARIDESLQSPLRSLLCKFRASWQRLNTRRCRLSRLDRGGSQTWLPADSVYWRRANASSSTPEPDRARSSMRRGVLGGLHKCPADLGEPPRQLRCPQGECCGFILLACPRGA